MGGQTLHWNPTWHAWVNNEIKSPMYEKLMKKNKHIRTNNKQENGLVYLHWAFQFDVINASTTYTKLKLWIKWVFFTYRIQFYFPMRKSLNFFSSIACNSMIASNKQRQRHNYLAAIQRGKKLYGAHELSKSLYFVKSRTQMRTLTRMDKVVKEDYYHMTLMDENTNWMKFTHILSKKSLNLRGGSFVHLPLLYDT